MNPHYALVKSLNDEFEEEVLLSLKGLEVTCFASVCPYEIQEGVEYPVSLELTILDDYQVIESDTEEYGFERIGNGFSHWVKGRLNRDTLDCGIRFHDSILLSDYGYLDGAFIRLKVDRIDAEFLVYQ